MADPEGSFARLFTGPVVSGWETQWSPAGSVTDLLIQPGDPVDHIFP